MTEKWTDSKIEEFIEDYYEDFLLEWLRKDITSWEAFMGSVALPMGRPYSTPEDASDGVWACFMTWFKLQPDFKEFHDWIVENLPDPSDFDC